nr:SOS response-associated peptidase family protein [uncultured Allomuricauda sp.]
MCYATAQSRKVIQIEKAMNAIAKLPEFLDDNDLARFHINGFAKQFMAGGTKVSEHPLMLIQPQENPKFLTPIMWGLIPRWEKGEEAAEYYKKTIGYGSGLNARDDKLFVSQMYKDSALHRRCVVPVTGFFEPYRVKPKKGKEFSIPFFFERRDKEITKLAGIYEFTNDGHVTFSIITREATPLFAKIHHTKKRRPVILGDEQVEGWLDNSSKRNDLEHIISTDMPDESLFAQPISRDLYKTKVDSNREDITTPVHHEEIEIDYENKPIPKDLFNQE